MRIFVTGGTGFLGKYLIKELLKKDYDVLLLSRKRIFDFYENNKKVNQLNKEIDLVNSNDLKDVSVIIHLACAGVSPKKANLFDILKVNVEAPIHLLNIGKDSNIERYIYAGTSHEYGLSANNYKYIPVNAPLNPTSLYGSSKASGFLLANSLSKKEGQKLIYTRIFTAYGDGQNINNFWPLLKKKALAGENLLMTNGQQLRDFISADLVAKDLVRLISCKDIKEGQPMILNIGSGKELSLANFAKNEWERFNAKGRIIFGALEEREDEPIRLIPDLNALIKIREKYL